MATLKTPNQQLPYPDSNEYLKYVPNYISALALAVEKGLVMKFTDQTDLGTRLPAPTSGMLAWVQADKILQIYDGDSWVSLYPATPAIYSGTGAPSSTLGVTGDIYIQT